MDQHPIPRQITTFEFKLIGFMTLRQFLYLLVAFPTAYIVIQIFPIPILNILLGVIIAVIGIVSAFLPIKDRTLDVWAKNLWRRLQNPTQYYYHKKNDSLYFLKDLYFLADPHHMLAHIESRDKLAQYLQTTKQRPKANYAKKQVNALLQSPTQVLTKSVAPVVPTNTAPPVPTLTATQQLVQNKPVGTAYVVPPSDAASPPVARAPLSPAVSKPVSEASPTPSTAQFKAVVIPPGQESASVQTPPAVSPAIPVPVVQPAVTAAPAPVSAQSSPEQAKPMFPMGGVGTYELHEKKAVVPSAPSAPQTQVSAPTPVEPAPAQMPVNTFAQSGPTVAPNTQSATSVTASAKSDPFLAGVIRTSKKIPLPGVLVYVKDPQGNPLRILKTNPHGVFATFNSLPAGDYAFEIKDPNGTYFFDTMNLAVKATNPMPFEFQSKEIL